MIVFSSNIGVPDHASLMLDYLMSFCCRFFSSLLFTFCHSGDVTTSSEADPHSTASNNTGGGSTRSSSANDTPKSTANSLPVVGDDSIMSKKTHGSAPRPVQWKLRFGVNRAEADRICCFNRHYAEPKQTFLRTGWWDEVHDKGEVTCVRFQSSLLSHVNVSSLETVQFSSIQQRQKCQC